MSVVWHTPDKHKNNLKLFLLISHSFLFLLFFCPASSPGIKTTGQGTKKMTQNCPSCWDGSPKQITLFSVPAGNAIQAYGMDDSAIKNMTVSEPSVTSKAMNEWMDSIPENPNPNPSSSPAVSILQWYSANEKCLSRYVCFFSTLILKVSIHQ